MDKQEFTNYLESFRKANPEIMKAVEVLNIDVDQYLRTVASLNPRSSSSSSSTCSS